MQLTLSCCLLLLLGATSLAQANTRAKVTVQNGPIVGEYIQAENREIARFLGVRYAQAPEGKLRFKKPRPVERWTEPVEAVKWPYTCIQNVEHPFVAIVKSLVLRNETSEDCLFLNIWSPNVEETDEAKLRPVIVWIHGGALLVGSSVLQWYDGETLAARADAVVVTINYRLSTMGFLYSDEVDDVKGNQGLWDQALALEWISENIRYFGGDPNAVTIMGESAGSWSVSLHVLSPVSRNYFHNAILMSGSALTNRVVHEPKDLVPKWLRGIRQVGCATEHDTTISQKIIECLQELDAETVYLVGYMVGDDPAQLPPLVVVDGEFLPERPADLLEKGDYKKNINILVNTVKDEGSFVFYFASPKFAQNNPERLTLEEAKEIFFDVLDKNLINYEAPRETIEKTYFDKLNGNNEEADAYRRQVGVAFGDFLLGCPTLDFVKQVFSNSPDTVKVYQWYYTAKLGRNKILDSNWGDTCHTDDIYAVFGGPFRTPQSFHNRERDISGEVMDFIKTFIRTGEPGPNQPEWQSYFLTEDGKDVIAPYYEIGNNYRTSDSFRYNLKHAECEFIWNKLAY